MTKNAKSKQIQPVSLGNVPHNKTTLFMLPSIGFQEQKTSFKLLKHFGFVNCYLKHTQSYDTYPDCLILIFNPKKEVLPRFKEFYTVYKTYPNYVEDYVIDLNLIAIVFKVLPKWVDSLAFFKQSKYSYMSKEYSELFKKLDFETGSIKAGTEYFIMRKDPDYRKHLEESLSVVTKDSRSIVKIDPEAELMSPLELDKEYFNYELP